MGELLGAQTTFFSPGPASGSVSRKSRRSVSSQGDRMVPACPGSALSIYGIIIWMYSNEGAHARPHFHARYAGQTASLDFAGAVIAGSLPRRALGLVAEWVVMHEDELAANWARARRDEPLEPIDALA